MTLFANGGDITPDTTKEVSPGSGPKTAGNLLLEFTHPQVPFSQIVIKRDAKISDKAEIIGFIGQQTVKQIAMRRLSDTAPLPWLTQVARSSVVSRSDNPVKQGQNAGLFRLGQVVETLSFGLLDHRPNGLQQTPQMVRPDLTGVSFRQRLQITQ